VEGFLREWWSSKGDYRWVVDYFEPRAMESKIRWLLAVCTALLGVVSAIMIFSPSGPRDGLPTAMVAAATVFTLVAALHWIFLGWPSWQLSAAFVVCGDLGIATVCWQYSNHLVGMYGLNSFVVLSLYLVFFHGPRALALHSAWALLSLTVFVIAVGWGPDGDPAMAIAQGLASVVIVVAIPPILQIGFWMMRSDADSSMVDPLTGLLNRRGLYMHAGELISLEGAADADVIVMVLDLDRFKHINDTHGHAIGDEVLVRSARRIKSVVRGGAVLARFGGEEFVLVDVIPRLHADAVAERIRAAIAAPTDIAPVTASIGVSCVSGSGFLAARMHLADLLDTMVVVADQAMYQAKRDGRDCVVVDLEGVDVASSSGSKTRLPTLASHSPGTGKARTRRDRRRSFDRRSGADRRLRRS
jgi:diguanylate cyclase (GGDEF)-like protein